MTISVLAATGRNGTVPNPTWNLSNVGEVDGNLLLVFLTALTENVTPPQAGWNKVGVTPTMPGTNYKTMVYSKIYNSVTDSSVSWIFDVATSGVGTKLVLSGNSTDPPDNFVVVSGTDNPLPAFSIPRQQGTLMGCLSGFISSSLVSPTFPSGSSPLTQGAAPSSGSLFEFIYYENLPSSIGSPVRSINTKASAAKFPYTNLNFTVFSNDVVVPVPAQRRYFVSSRGRRYVK
jgi:hypothetical protein